MSYIVKKDTKIQLGDAGLGKLKADGYVTTICTATETGYIDLHITKDHLLQILSQAKFYTESD